MPSQFAGVRKQWLKAKPVTMTKTGVSEVCRKIEAKLKDYDRQAYLKMCETPEELDALTKKLAKLFAPYIKELTATKKADDRITKNKKTRAFFDGLLKELSEEESFWKSGKASAPLQQAAREMKGLIRVTQREVEQLTAQFDLMQKEMDRIRDKVLEVDDPKQFAKELVTAGKIHKKGAELEKRRQAVLKAMEKEALSIGQTSKEVVNREKKTFQPLVVALKKDLKEAWGKLQSRGLDIQRKVKEAGLA